MDYKSVFTNLCLELQQNRSWIKGLGKNPFTHSIPFHSLIPWRQCLLSGGTEACSVGLRETPACIHVIQRLSQLPAWLSKNRMRVYMLSDMRSKKKLRVYTASEAKGLMNFQHTFCTLSSRMVAIWSLEYGQKCSNSGLHFGLAWRRGRIRSVKSSALAIPADSNHEANISIITGLLLQFAEMLVRYIYFFIFFFKFLFEKNTNTLKYDISQNSCQKLDLIYSNYVPKLMYAVN